MSDIPIVPDSDRRSTATLSASVGPVTVGFAIYGGADDLSVFVDGELIDPADWTLTSNSGLNVSTDVLPAGDGRVTFDDAQTGDVEVIGEIKPKRISQFTTGVGIPAESHNLILSTIIAALREVFVWGKAAIKLNAGERAAKLPAAEDRAEKVLSFDADGNPVAEIDISALEDVQTYADQAATSASSAATSLSTITTLLNAADFVFFEEGVPSDGFGSDGDVYVNTAHARWSVYGPKAAGVWGSIVGYMFGQDGLGTGDLQAANNLTDLANRQAGHDNLSLKGSDIASASTINLDTATGSLVDVTGTTTITAVTLSEGRRRIVRFTGALTLTHGASLVLPGSANITTAAGDFAIFAGYAAGVVRCVAYLPASGARSDLVVTLAGAQTVSGVKTFTGFNKVQALKEKWNIVADNLASGDNNFDILTAAAWYWTTAGDTNATLNFRGDGSNSLNSLLAIGDSVTVAAVVTHTGTAYRITALKVDGSAVTPKWVNGSAPSAGSINANDVYTFTILKTADAAFTIFAQMVKWDEA